MSAAFLRVVRVLGCIVVPFAFAQAAASPALFFLIWGERWISAVPVFVAISIAQAASFALPTVSLMLKAQGRFRTVLVVHSIYAAIAVTAYAAICSRPSLATSAASRFGIDEQSAIPTVIASINALILFVLGPITLKVALPRQCRESVNTNSAFYLPILITAPIGVVAFVIAHAMSHECKTDPFVLAIIALLVFGGTFVMCCAVCARINGDAWNDLAGISRRALGRLRWRPRVPK